MDRIWFSGWWRLGWATALALLLTAQAAMAFAAGHAARRLRATPAGPPDRPAVLTGFPDLDLAAELGLTPAGSLLLAGPDVRSIPTERLSTLPPTE